MACRGLMNELFVVCINYGYEGWTLDVYDNEKDAVERTQESYGSPFRIFKGVELGLSFKDKNRGATKN